MNISIGEQATLTKTLTADDIQRFVGLSGDSNPIHMNATERFGEKCICHGMLVASLISAVLGTSLPGPGTIYLEQLVRFVRPVFIGDEVTACVEVINLRDSRSGQIITLQTNVWNQENEMVISGEAKVLFPIKEQ